MPYDLLRPLLFVLPPEVAHGLSTAALDWAAAAPGVAGALGRWTAAERPTEVFGLRFPNPVGLAAGFDDELTAAGEGVGGLLRREALYSSHLSEWRKAREAGLLEAMKAKKRGPKPGPDVEMKRDSVRLQRENQRLQKELSQAALVITVSPGVQVTYGGGAGAMRTGDTGLV